uniref:hypothetical protein n=1 Tax=Rhodococcus erythropolis TaxID=1833 RepID=UPI00209C3C3E|nr:hypothetical protein [Rhodococcus erythropolis]
MDRGIVKAILATAASILLVVALAVAILLLLSGSPRERTSHELADTEHTIGGQPTTCTELFGETCSFALQSDYNQWGQNLESFVNAGTLGPFARSIGFVVEAKLSLQACEVSATAGRTILDFYTLAGIDHPAATTTDLFPFWNESRQFLCPVDSF